MNGLKAPQGPPQRRPADEAQGSSPAFTRFAWGVAAYSLLVILWGYFLRISESGDGCGTDWPLCHGEVLPTGSPFPTFVEFSHRLTSGIVLLLVVALYFWARRRFPKGHAVRTAAGFSLLLTLTESLFGAILVVFGWVATDISTGRILIRPVHVTNTFLLMAALLLTAWWAHRGVSALPRPRTGSALGSLRPLLLPLGGFMALSWTGAWTGLAATAFPAETVREGMGQYLDPEHLLIYLRMTHPLLALGVIWALLRFARSTWQLAHDAAPWDRALPRLALGIGVLASLQLVAGPVTIVLGNPVSLRLTHLLLADLLWAALVVTASARLEAATPE
jgi:heme A synthase